MVSTGEFTVKQTPCGELVIMQGKDLAMSTGVHTLNELIEACFTGEEDNFSDYCFERGYDQRSRAAHENWVRDCDLYLDLYNLSEDLYFAIRNFDT